MTETTESNTSTGWDAISSACAVLYPGQEPKHFGTLISYRLGGPDPLQGISAWKRTEPVPHWHFVTYGFSELYEKESDDKDVSGYGFELTFRLKTSPDAQEPPVWPLNFLQNLARYVFQSGNVFRNGDWMTANGPIALTEDTRICSMGFVGDPELQTIQTPNGQVEFLQVVGLTKDEESAAKQWKTNKLLEALKPGMPLWITDLARPSLLTQPDIRNLVAQGTQEDGSSTGYLWTDVLGWRKENRFLAKAVTVLELGARQIEELTALLPLRLPFGRPFRIIGKDTSIVLAPGEQNGLREEEGALHVDLTDETVREIASTLKAQRGTYHLSTFKALRFVVEPTQIKDAQGNVIQTVG